MVVLPRIVLALAFVRGHLDGAHIHMQRFVSTTFVLALLATTSRPATANDLWVAPTSQQDLGGMSVASNTVWPVTPVGAVRLAFAVPGDLQAFQGARLSLIPGSSSAGAVLNLLPLPGFSQ
jgi:hypothetical protein